MLMCNPPMVIRQPTEGKRLRADATLIHNQSSPLHGGMGYIPEDVAGLFQYPHVLAMVPASPPPQPMSLHAAFHEDAYNKRFKKMSATQKHDWIKKFARDCKEGVVVGCHTDFVGPEKKRRVSFWY